MADRAHLQLALDGVLDLLVGDDLHFFGGGLGGEELADEL